MTDTLIQTLLTTGPHKILPTTRRVRVIFNGFFVVDTTSARHVWEHPYYPQFYIPLSSIDPAFLDDTTSQIHPDAPVRTEHEAFRHTLSVGDKDCDKLISFHGGDLDGYVKIDFEAMDAWFEEDIQIYGHPKNPFTRIDILPSSRRVRVEIEGVTVAESSKCSFLYETGLRTRYYMPKTDVKLNYLTPSATTTKCPYKGEAQYYNVVIKGKEHKDLVWWYQYPTTESAAIAGLACFYNEKVDVFVEGVKEK